MNKEEAPRKCRNKPKNGGADEHQLAIDTEFLEAVADLQIAKVKQMLDAGQVNNGNVGNEDGKEFDLLVTVSDPPTLYSELYTLCCLFLFTGPLHG